MLALEKLGRILIKEYYSALQTDISNGFANSGHSI